MTECLEIFKEMLQREERDIVLDTYLPADGTYILVQEIDGKLTMREPAVLKYDKKKNEMSGRTHIDYQDLKFYDYYSKLIDMNKPIDSKKIIQSNNYFSFVIKKESLANGKLNQDIIDGYYEVLLHPEKKYNRAKKSKEIYQMAVEKLMPIQEEELKKTKAWIEKNIFSLDPKQVPLEGKDYLKIFFEWEGKEKAKKSFQNENKRYLIPNVYNNNEFNRMIDGKLWGVPNNNMGLNAKKPYLENKTRGTSVPYLLDIKTVLFQNLFFDYLHNLACQGKVNVYIDMGKRSIDAYANGEIPKERKEGIFLRLQKGKKEAEIHSVDRVVGFSPKLSKTFFYENVLEFDLNIPNTWIPTYGKIATIQSMQELINEVLFSKFLVTNYFTKPEDISIKEGFLKNNLLLARETLFHWFYKGNIQGVEPLIDQVSLAIIKGNICIGHFKRAIHQFNFRVSWKDYAKGGEKGMEKSIKHVKSALWEKINQKDTSEIESEEEFYFAVGQAVNYFISLSKNSKKMHSLANPFFHAKSNEQLKENLRKFFIKYNYTIECNGRRFNQLYAMICGYEATGNINQDMMIAGYLSSSLIYKKSKEEEDTK